MTGQGGWPMTCVLTPDGEPFFAGTYFPPEPRARAAGLRPGAVRDRRRLDDRRDEITKSATTSREHLRGTHELPGATPPTSAQPPSASWQAPSTSSSRGFGGAPKFPPSMVCEFLLRRAARVDDADALCGWPSARSRRWRAAASTTSWAAASPATASTRAGRCPHFEKMLYDNALLLRVYMHWCRLTGSALAERVARETADFLLRELAHRRGGVRVGARRRLRRRGGHLLRLDAGPADDVLGADDGHRGRRSSSASPRLATSRTAPRRCASPSDPLDVAPPRPGAAPALPPGSGGRGRPATTRWSPAGTVSRSPRWPRRASSSTSRGTSAAPSRRRRLVSVCISMEPGQLRRVSRDGVVGEPAGVLEDYACVADGLLTLFGATGDEQWFA